MSNNALFFGRENNPQKTKDWATWTLTENWGGEIGCPERVSMSFSTGDNCLVTIVKHTTIDCKRRKKNRIVTRAWFTYRFDRLKPRAATFRGLPAKVYNILTLSLDFHTYVVIAHSTLQTKTLSNFLYTVALHFRILQYFKHPSSSSPLFKLSKNSSIFL